jgi:hypothetical protein
MIIIGVEFWFKKFKENIQMGGNPSHDEPSVSK